MLAFVPRSSFLVYCFSFNANLYIWISAHLHIYSMVYYLPFFISKFLCMDRALIEKREVTATAERVVQGNIWSVAPGVWRMKDVFVNVFLIQNSANTKFVLITLGSG